MVTYRHLRKHYLALLVIMSFLYLLPRSLSLNARNNKSPNGRYTWPLLVTYYCYCYLVILIVAWLQRELYIFITPVT